MLLKMHFNSLNLEQSWSVFHQKSSHLAFFPPFFPPYFCTVSLGDKLLLHVQHRRRCATGPGGRSLSIPGPEYD